MVFLTHIFRIYLLITSILSLVSLPIAGDSFYSIAQKKGYKHPWICFLPFVCFYPFFTFFNGEFKLFGFIKVKNRKAVAIYYISSSVALAFLCLLGKILLFTASGPITLYANIHFISLILFVIQFIVFRTKAYYDFFIVCQMRDTSFSLALLSVFFPLVFPITVVYLNKNGRLDLLEKTSPATNQIS